jgi:hypothetical protein
MTEKKKPADIKIQNGCVLYCTARLCHFLGISQVTLRKWVKEGCPQVRRGWYDLEHVLLWRGYIGNSRPVGDTELQAISLQEQKLKVEIQYKQTMTELAEYKREIANGSYIRRELVNAELSRFFTVFKTAVRNIPRKIGAQLYSILDPIEARRIEQDIQDIVDRVLRQFVRKFGEDDGP